MTTQPSDLLLPGYWVDPGTGAWCSLPWPSDPDEKVELARSSLGPQIIDWSEGRTDEPGLIHYMTGDPWRWTDGQKRFLILWYALSPGGRFVYRSGVKRGAKGTGKDPMAAAMCDCELLGPVEPFDWDDGSGRPVGRRRGFPLVQVMSNSEDQSKKVLRIANGMWSREARDFYGLDCGETRTVIKGTGARFEVPTSAEASSEGDPSTFMALNEALALDTPLPTPSGWTTMGQVAVGDEIVGWDGEPTVVRAATPVQHGRRCYRVTFADGTNVVASDGHLWLTKRSGSAAKPRIRTTQEIADTPGWCRIPRAGAMSTPDIDLPIDPYVLGLWLGDGDARAPTITAGLQDVDETIAHVEARGYVTTRCDSRQRAPRFRFSIPGARRGGSFDTNPIESLRARLITAGVRGAKHIPGVYLRAGTKQRLDLLRGLMDSDGCITRSGFAIFVNDNDRLADGFIELARSLGQAPRRTWAPDPRSRQGGCHRVTFTPRGITPVSLGRKVARLRPDVYERSQWMTINSVVEVESVPVRCITVAADDCLFLAGEGWVATHNSHHMTSSSGGDNLAAVARRNVGKSPASVQARLCEYTNAHRQGMGSVAEESFLAWQAQTAAGYKGNRDILYDTIEAPPGSDIMSEQGRLVALNAAYLDAPWNDIQRKSDEIMDRRTTVADSIRFYLNGLGTEEDAWVEPARWDQLANPGTALADGDRVALFADCSKSSDATGIVGCRLSDLFVFQVGCWERPHGLPHTKLWRAPRAEFDSQLRAAVDKYDVVWLGIDPSPAKDDTEDALYWRAVIDGLHRDLAKRMPLWATPGSGGVTGHSVLFDMRTSQSGGLKRNQAFTQSAEYVAGLIDDDDPAENLRHDGSSRLRVHVHNARRRPNPWGVSLGKVTRDSNKHVDLAVCMVGAVMGARTALNSGKLRRRRAPGKVVVLS